MTKEQTDYLENYNGYDKELIENAFKKRASVEQIESLQDEANSIFEFRSAVAALAAGLDISFAKYLVSADLKYDARKEALKGFNNGISLEQAQSYFHNDDEGSQIEGICRLLLSTTEENAAPYLRQSFRLKQYECIAHGFKHGYTKEQLELYAKPEIRAHTMQIACELIDKHISNETVKVLTEPALNSEQLDILRDAALERVPVSVLKICAKKNYLPLKMRLIIQGYKEGFSEVQLLQLADTEIYDISTVFGKIKTENMEEKTVCTSDTYENLRNSLIKLSDSLNGAQKKELVNILLFGEIA
ncbi:MAG: hypothetical protein J5966_08900 [Lachnospiraceae bacterium]|nr:hypothetical protein [Lachnospiraceae bacterium]